MNNVSIMTSEKENSKNLLLLCITHVYFSLQLLKGNHLTPNAKKLEIGRIPMKH